jgi:hypothetical protein
VGTRPNSGVDTSKRQEAVDWAVEYLRDRYPEAKLQEKSMGALGLAYPKGFIPEHSRDGILKSVSIAPDSEAHVLSLLKEASSSQEAFDAVLAWASVELLKSNTISNRSISLFVSHYLIGNVSRPLSKGRPAKQNKHLLRHAGLRFVVANLEHRGFYATRNDGSTHRNSACDIVADAMVKLKCTPCTYRSIKAILSGGDRVHFNTKE